MWTGSGLLHSRKRRNSCHLSQVDERGGQCPTETTEGPCRPHRDPGGVSQSPPWGCPSTPSFNLQAGPESRGAGAGAPAGSEDLTLWPSCADAGDFSIDSPCQGTVAK